MQFASIDPNARQAPPFGAGKDGAGSSSVGIPVPSGPGGFQSSEADSRSRLCVGIKRSAFRANDARSSVADAEFEAMREPALAAGRYRCRYCGYESTPNLAKKRPSALQVHHLDDDHHNNEPRNLAAVDSLCHAYHHIGCNAPSPGAPQGWSDRLRMAYLPEVSAEDVNVLQRAIGAALLDDAERAVAQEILKLLGALALPVRDAWGSNKAGDFAACLSNMTSGEYERAQHALSGLRVLFHPEILKISGQQLLDDAPLLSVRSWDGLLRAHIEQSAQELREE